MTSEQKFIWWLKGVLDSCNNNPDFELIKEELEKVVASKDIPTTTVASSWPYKTGVTLTGGADVRDYNHATAPPVYVPPYDPFGNPNPIVTYTDGK